MPVFPIGAIVAAAAKSARDNEFSGIGSDLYKSTTVYGNLIINKYYKFPETKYLKPIKTLGTNLEVVTVGSEILLFSKEFLIEIDLTKSNIDNGIREAIKKYSADEFWEYEDMEIVENYCSHLRVEYGINPSVDKIKYSVEYHPYKFKPV
jgi:hypothetical protein